MAPTAYLAFYGTRCAIVRGVTEDDAYRALVALLNRSGSPHYGRVMPPTRDEVTIRRPTERDRAWIEDSGDPAYVALLADLCPA